MRDFHGWQTLTKTQHRDLHENNICVLANTIPPRKRFPNADYGRSGLTVTLIDYGLSRAKLTRKFSANESTIEEVAFKDLELDLEVFQGPKGQMQFETYRQFVATSFFSILYLPRRTKTC